MSLAIIVAGPSAVGKTTVINRLIEKYSHFEYVRSATTREKRGDGNDSEYIYLSENEFLQRIKDGEMLEYTEYAGKYYGTPKMEVERIIKEGKTPLLILDIQGVKSLKSGNYSFCTLAVYLYDDIEIIHERLTERLKKNYSENAEAIFKKRCAQNKADYISMPSYASYFDAFIKNRGIEESSEQILEAIERIKSFGVDVEKNKAIAENIKKTAISYKNQGRICR